MFYIYLKVKSFFQYGEGRVSPCFWTEAIFTDKMEGVGVEKLGDRSMEVIVRSSFQLSRAPLFAFPNIGIVRLLGLFVCLFVCFSGWCFSRVEQNCLKAFYITRLLISSFFC